MDDKIKKNLLSGSLWLRIFYMVVFYLISQVSIMLIAVLSVAQVLFSLLTGNTNLNLQVFSVGLNSYVNQMLCFLTFNNDKKPYPFSDWPKKECKEECKESKGSTKQNKKN